MKSTLFLLQPRKKLKDFFEKLLSDEQHGPDYSSRVEQKKPLPESKRSRPNKDITDELKRGFYPLPMPLPSGSKTCAIIAIREIDAARSILQRLSALFLFVSRIKDEYLDE